MTRRHLVLVAYDISCDRRRARVLARVRGFGLGGQKSVHECRLSRREAEELWQSMRALTCAETDRLLMIRLDPRAPVVTLGIARPPADPALWTVE